LHLKITGGQNDTNTQNLKFFILNPIFFFILLILYEISCMRFSNRFDLTRAFSLMEMIKGSQEEPIPQMIN
jgi:hypothetical protein